MEPNPDLRVDPTVRAAADHLGGRVDVDLGHVRWWVDDPSPTLVETAAELGLAPARHLLKMQRALPLDAPSVDLSERLTVRGYRDDSDEQRWLDINNAAFSWHPDQGHWDLGRFRSARSEPTFERDDLRIGELRHRDDQGNEQVDTVGFCWTKVHIGDPSHRDGPAGEIYVIAVDPRWHGRGLGRALTVAGLDWLWTRHRTPVGLLFVEADNSAAIATYRSLGFDVVAERHSFEPSTRPTIDGTPT